MSLDLVLAALPELQVSELLTVKKQIDADIQNRQNAERQRLRDEFFAKVQASGLTVDEVLGKAPRTKSAERATVAPKYRNPANAAETWSGRGRKPAWVTSHLEAGGALVDLEINH